MLFRSFSLDGMNTLSRVSIVVLKVFARAVVLVVVLKEPSGWWVIARPEASSIGCSVAVAKVDEVEMDAAFDGDVALDEALDVELEADVVAFQLLVLLTLG